MFRAVPEPMEIGESAGYSATDPVPLSVLGLRWGSEGWPNFLGRRAMPMIPDSLGRDSVSHSHARQLLDEAREAELRRRKRVAILQAEQDGISSEPPRFGGAAR